jgi:hypothetical protein
MASLSHCLEPDLAVLAEMIIDLLVSSLMSRRVMLSYPCATRQQKVALAFLRERLLKPVEIESLDINGYP